MINVIATPAEVLNSADDWNGRRVRAILEVPNSPVEGILSINIGAFLVGEIFLNDVEIIKFERLD
jgi:hypothetical protein